MTEKQTLIIVGASVRAAAFTALRAGLQPWCLDLFADADLAARCPVRRLDPATYPRCLLDEIRRAPPGPWMYTGGLENHPKLIATICRERTLLGTGPESLRLVRSPYRLAALLRQSGVNYPSVSPHTPTLDPSRRWLVKPIKSAGGTGIRIWSSNDLHRPGTYYQQVIEGESYSALFFADSTTSQLLGVTRQLVGRSWLNARPYAYCGSITPSPFADSIREQIERAGQSLSRDAGVRGFFGIDLILQDQVAWLIEVNPRYTASLEVLEHQQGIAMGRLLGGSLNVNITGISAGPRVGKAILFAADTFCFPAEGPWMTSLQADRPLAQMPRFADIPAAGTLIHQGWPILTLFAAGSDATAVEQNLEQTAMELSPLFEFTSRTS